MPEGAHRMGETTRPLPGVSKRAPKAAGMPADARQASHSTMKREQFTGEASVGSPAGAERRGNSGLRG